MLILGFLKRLKMDMNNIDPLGTSKWALFFNLVDKTMQANAFYLLIRLVADIPLSHSSVVILQYVFNYTVAFTPPTLTLKAVKRFLNLNLDQ